MLPRHRPPPPQHLASHKGPPVAALSSVESVWVERDPPRTTTARDERVETTVQAPSRGNHGHQLVRARRQDANCIAKNASDTTASPVSPPTVLPVIDHREVFTKTTSTQRSATKRHRRLRATTTSNLLGSAPTRRSMHRPRRGAHTTPTRNDRQNPRSTCPGSTSTVLTRQAAQRCCHPRARYPKPRNEHQTTSWRSSALAQGPEGPQALRIGTLTGRHIGDPYESRRRLAQVALRQGNTHLPNPTSADGHTRQQAAECVRVEHTENPGSDRTRHRNPTQHLGTKPCGLTRSARRSHR